MVMMTDDLISRRAAIDAICKDCVFIDDCCEDNSERCEDYVILRDLPPAEPERKKGEWIPCSETLPKSWGKYLTTVKFHSQNLIWFLYYTDNLEKVDKFKFKGETRPAWYRYDTEYGHLETIGVVTAWMPLPKPYEE